MPFNERDVQGWTVDSLRNYFTSRGVKVAGEDRKADLIRKVLTASLLNLPEAPSNINWFVSLFNNNMNV